MEWWQQDQYEIKVLTSIDAYIEILYARNDHGYWEYAITRWCYGTPKLLYTFYNGAIDYDYGGE